MAMKSNNINPSHLIYNVKAINISIYYLILYNNIASILNHKFMNRGKKQGKRFNAFRWVQLEIKEVEYKHHIYTCFKSPDP